MRIEVDLESTDFEKIVAPPPNDGGKFVVMTGATYGFMSKLSSAVGKVRAPNLTGPPVKLRFENADGTVWGKLEPETWLTARPEDFFKKGQWGTAFLIQRGWIMQQVQAAEALGHDKAGCGLFFKYADELKGTFGPPAKIVAEFEIVLRLLD